MIERGKIDTHKTHIHDRSLSGLGTGTSIKGGRCGEHSDYAILTLLFQDLIGGLEVTNKDIWN
jgi:isopenicillin N synthase-like dioxygenase